MKNKLNKQEIEKMVDKFNEVYGSKYDCRIVPVTNSTFKNFFKQDFKVRIREDDSWETTYIAMCSTYDMGNEIHFFTNYKDAYRYIKHCLECCHEQNNNEFPESISALCGKKEEYLSYIDDENHTLYFIDEDGKEAGEIVYEGFESAMRRCKIHVDYHLSIGVSRKYVIAWLKAFNLKWHAYNID